jgi:hypothetical protein
MTKNNTPPPAHYDSVAFLKRSAPHLNAVYMNIPMDGGVDLARIFLFKLLEGGIVASDADDPKTAGSP